MTVENCTLAHDVNGVCLGPPDTFTGDHRRVTQKPAEHIRHCAGCRATMMRCWRDGCDRAGDPYVELALEACEKIGRRARRLGSEAHDDAEDYIYVELVCGLLGQNGWSPEELLAVDDALTRLMKAAENDYNTWFRNYKRALAIQDFLVDEANQVAAHPTSGDGSEPVPTPPTIYEATRIALAEAAPGSHQRPRTDDDPAELVSDRFRFELVSPELAQMALDTISRAMSNLRPDDARLLAGFMRHFSRGGSLRSYCIETHGRDPQGRPARLTTTQRNIKRIGVELAGWLDIGFDPVADDQEVAMYFLHTFLTTLDSDEEKSTDD